MKTFNQFHVKMFEFHFMCLLENCNFSTSVVKNTISRQFEVLYFFRNFREISRKMGQNLSHFAKNSKRKSIATLFITQMLLNVEFTCRNNNCFIQCCIDRMFSPPQGFQNLYSMSLRKILLMIFFLCPNKVIYDVILNLC